MSEGTSARPWTAMVVGGCGFFGQHLVKHLVAAPDFENVAVIDLKTDRNRVNSVSYYDADIGSPSAVSAIFAKVQPDVVFHTAAPRPDTSSLSLLLRVNVEGTRNTLVQAKSNSVSAFVYTSSASVIHDGRNDLLEVEESARVLYLPEQQEIYGHSKTLAEDLVLAANSNDLRTAAIRPSSIFGEGDIVMVARFVELGRKGRANTQFGDGKNLYDFTYAGNLADAHILAAQKLLTRDSSNGRVDGEAFFITNDEHMPFWTFAREISGVAGFPVAQKDIRVIPGWLGLCMAFISVWATWALTFGYRESVLTVAGARAAIMTRTYDISKAKKRLGYRPTVDMKEGITRAARWYVSLTDDKKFR